MARGTLEGTVMRKRIVKVYLSREQVDMLDKACERLGQDRSDLVRGVLLNYLKDINLVREWVHE